LYLHNDSLSGESADKDKMETPKEPAKPEVKVAVEDPAAKVKRLSGLLRERLTEELATKGKLGVLQAWLQSPE
jgi:hypothetical protein